VIISIIAVSIVHIPLLHFGVVWSVTEGAIEWLLEFLEKLPELIEKIPLHYISLKTPTLLQVVCAYLVIWLVVQIIDNRSRDTVFKAISGVVLVLMLVIGFIDQHPGLEIYFVNVGQGDSAILNTSAGETILIDGGGAAEYYTGDYNVGDRVLVPYMTSHGFNKVDYAIVSHYHKDHVEGVISVVKNMRVRNLVMPDCDKGNIYRQELEALAREKNIKILYAKEGDSIRMASGLKIKFLAPSTDQLKDKDLNTTSLVMRVDYNYFCGVFTGDSDDGVDGDYPQYADILKVSHHGSKNSNNAWDLQRISPRYAVISVGKDNVYGLPSQEVLEALEDAGARVLRTDVLGDIRFKINKFGIITYDSLRKE
jgi:competence protein ComEC